MGKFLGCSSLSMASESSRRSLQIPCSTVLNWFLKLKKPKKRGQIMDDSRKNGGVRRVKFVFTKKEATQLLAMYVGGQDAMMFGMIASYDIERKEAKAGSRSGGWKPALESIPED
ncbi:hypothetical protein ZIOFF_051385 [Zingiber officinale]|uniref:Uncharacterized protein n=1 Tax=Zingiber officinale TaxID=94328 RepID=A0A8J5FMM9_ZINOF|nr:hypothetical protein ZIOFF_051385 [Zingiber officinale]